ncbi:S8 family peptidase [Cohnella sp.]|uniref:S8 family peptidase n=1 Tax=Cohnella sp. TaxID=1883426 RepID=UPI003564B96E
MHRKTLFGILFTFAAVLLAIPLFPVFFKQSQPLPSPPRSQEMQSVSRNEAIYKQQTVQNDMKATELLSRSQVTRDIRNFLQTNDTHKSRLKLQKLLTIHPEILFIEWSEGKQQKTVGSIPSELSPKARPHLSKARSSLQKVNFYESPTFLHQGKSFFVLSSKSASANHSIVALISTEVVQAVEKHQRRNMRLVPYPAEGRYRIESVIPGTNADITVKKGDNNGNASHYAIDEIVVKFRTPLTERQLLQLRNELDLTIVRHTGKIYVFRSKKHKAMELKAHFLRKWNPEYVEPHYLYLTNALDEVTEEPPIVPNDTLYSEYQWNLPEIATENGWSVTKGSADVVVAVLDTGVQSDHPDLKGRLVEGINIVDPSSAPEDDVGHGTHVAGIIAAEVNNNEGVAGMTWFTKIMPVKVLDSTGAGSTYSVAEGIIWATDHGANIINMSLGNYAEAEFLHDALKYAYERGVVLVAASGNDNTDRPGFPAAYPEVLAVSATDADESRADYSNYGDYIDVAAPGTSIPSTYPGSRYAALSGTSMASPHVAALASLVRAANPGLGNEEIMELLRTTSKDLGASGKDYEYGYGQIDVRSALQSASGINNSLQLYPQQVRRELERLNQR